MKKTTIIIIAQFVLATLLLVYALVQRTQAIKLEELAMENAQEAMRQKVMADQNAEEAKRQEALAREAQMLSVTQMEAAQKALADCARGKK